MILLCAWMIAKAIAAPITYDPLPLAIVLTTWPLLWGLILALYSLVRGAGAWGVCRVPMVVFILVGPTVALVVLVIWATCDAFLELVE